MIGCVGWRQTSNCDGHGARDSNSDLSCGMTVGSDRSGYCECTFGFVARTNCNHRRFNCDRMCLKGFEQMDNDKSYNWLENTVWKWNNWRDVKFLEDSVFWAPTPDCEMNNCFWKVREGKIFILWGDDGIHTVQPTKNKRKLVGKRYDGEKLEASFLREEKEEEEEDLYDVLGVDVDSTQDEIRKAYRKLSRDLHPDKIKSDSKLKEETEAKFIKVQEAYEILKDDDTRMVYDTGGLEAIQNIKDPQQQQRGMDPFSMFFGGGQAQRSNRGNDISLNMEVSLELLYTGGEATHNFNRRVVCRRCAKITEKNSDRCSKCRVKCPGEVKMVQRRMGNMLVQQQEEQPSKERCTKEDAVLNVQIEKGMTSGDEIKFERKNEQTPGQIPGDVIVKIKQRQHKTFERINKNDLKTKITVTLKAALTGVDITLTHLDGHEVRIKTDSTDVIYPKKVLRIKDEGMPFHNFPSQKGILFVEFEIDFPKSLNNEQVQAISQLF